jgi:translation initiation factor IF-3
MKKIKIKGHKGFERRDEQLSAQCDLQAINLKLKETNSTLTEANLVKFTLKVHGSMFDYIGKLEGIVVN